MTDGPESCPEQALQNDAAVSGLYGSWIVDRESRFSTSRIVVRFQLWKDKEMVVRAARRIRPEGTQFF